MKIIFKQSKLLLINVSQTNEVNELRPRNYNYITVIKRHLHCTMKISRCCRVGLQDCVSHDVCMWTSND